MNGVWRWLLAAVWVLTAAACSSDGDAAEVSGATVPTEATTSTTLSVEQEVEQAYLKSWDVYAEAMKTRDPAVLERAFIEEALRLAKQDLDKVGEGQMALIRVEHDYRIEVVSPTEAEVFDEYLNHSVLADASGNPLEPDPNETVRSHQRLRKIGESWKVYDARLF